MMEVDLRKSFDAEGGAVAGGACGREGVARACDVISQDVRGVVAEEQGPRVSDQINVSLRVLDHPSRGAPGRRGWKGRWPARLCPSR